MFCDLVGSTPLSSRLDPEDLGDVIRGYQSSVATIVERFGGFIARYVGDGVLIYFGWPKAQEADAERAVRAALAIVGAIGRAPILGEQLQVRIGIATGLVVVGEPIGAGEARQQTAIGETPNRAARLQALAESNGVVIDGGTHQQLGRLFECRYLGAVEIKGLPEPVESWAVHGESAVKNRFEALHSAELTPLIGRGEEVDLLLRRWRQAESDEGNVVLISGEPGIGKSRLLAALVERLRGEPCTRLRLFCSPYHQDSPLYPVIAQMEHAAGFVRDDTTESKLGKIRAMLVGATASDENTTLVAELLVLPADASLPVLELSPQRRKERTFAVLMRQLAALAANQPVLMLVEDAHWADPSTRELFDQVIESIAGLPVLLVMTCRPEFEMPWTGRARVSVLTLGRLDARDTAALAASVAARAMAPELIERIVEQTDGVPLFVEELTRAVSEAGPSVAAGIERLAVPETLQASLLARLDRLPEAKTVAQIGAVIGRSFSHELVGAIAGLPEPALQDGLAQLVGAGLAFEDGVPPEAIYTFKHALVQDAAYSTLLRGTRQILHSRIADAFLSTKHKRLVAAPEIIARHLQSANRMIEAIGHCREAGEQAVSRAAYLEGIGHFRHALSLIEAQPETAERWRAELAILSRLCAALMNVHGRSATEVGDTIERAAQIGRRLESSADLAPTIANLWRFNLGRGRFDRADEISADLFRIARELDDPGILLQAHHTAWPARWVRGLLLEATEHANAGLMLYDEKRHAHHRYIYFGHDPAVCALAVGAVAHWALGHAALAARQGNEAIARARKLQDAPSLAHALWLVCEHQVARSDGTAAIGTANELLKLSDEHGLSQPRAYALSFLGWALARTGETAEGIARLEEGLGELNRMGVRTYLTRSHCLMGEGLLAARRYPEGLHHVSQGLDVAKEIGEHWYLPRLHQVRAELLLHANGLRDEAAEASLRQALTSAQQQDAKGWELRAATSLARLWLERGNRRAASDLLGPIYGWFTDGFEMPDLQEARALLEALN
jgi:class 3 adenylate cyclase/predicted ATPase